MYILIEINVFKYKKFAYMVLQQGAQGTKGMLIPLYKAQLKKHHLDPPQSSQQPGLLKGLSLPVPS